MVGAAQEIPCGNEYTPPFRRTVLDAMVVSLLSGLSHRSRPPGDVEAIRAPDQPSVSAVLAQGLPREVPETSATTKVLRRMRFTRRLAYRLQIFRPVGLMSRAAMEPSQVETLLEDPPSAHSQPDSSPRDLLHHAGA